ncbi:hypothetical protein [Photobacterium damselae]|uniref:Uncharacterized protein n=1 Tax=Photobacterium damselae subsp. damselae TaxID=85581 RepID=A0AAD3WYW8_PHODD|nr:hypothetical protein [Photobacterium damselae]KAB1181446.1 hypothetical protein F6450_08830 [Photobacterium damselae subsp. damselae]
MNKIVLFLNSILLSLLAGYLSYRAAISLCDPDYGHWVDGKCQTMPSMIELIAISAALASPIALLLSMVVFFILKRLKNHLSH